MQTNKSTNKLTKKPMIKPEILGISTCGCAFSPLSVAVAGAGVVTKVGGSLVCAGFCFTPMVATTIGVGIVA